MSVLPDEIDRKILAELQRDASRSLDEIARKVGSSKTPVWNRIRKLRENFTQSHASRPPIAWQAGWLAPWLLDSASVGAGSCLTFYL